MKTPRYTVGSVTGYSASSGGTARREVTVWYVHDSAFCYRIVGDFRGQNAEKRARTLALELNTTPAPRMDAWRAGLATHCGKGHEMTDENTRWYTSRGRYERQCRKCQEAFNALRRERRRAA